MEPIVFEIEIPDVVLSPNSRAKWQVKHPEKVFARDEAELKAHRFIFAWQAKHNKVWTPLKTASAQANFCFKTARRRDKDNFDAMLKHTWDGFTRAGLWEDDCGLSHHPTLLTFGALKPRCEITVYPNGTGFEGLSHIPTEAGDL